ncbi:conserved hypothetical protein, partial [Ricinus communis]
MLGVADVDAIDQILQRNGAQRRRIRLVEQGCNIGDGLARLGDDIATVHGLVADDAGGAGNEQHA